MAQSSNPNEKPSVVVQQGNSRWDPAKPLPSSFVSGAKVKAATQEITGLSDADFKYFRKPMPLERELSDLVSLYVQAWLKDPELAKASGNKVPTLDQLLAPPKGVLVRIRRRAKGEFKDVDVIAATELQHRMRDLYLHYTTNAQVSGDGYYWSFLPLLNGKANPAVVTEILETKLADLKLKREWD